MGEKPADCPPAFIASLNWYHLGVTDRRGLAALLWVAQWLLAITAHWGSVTSSQTAKLGTEYCPATWPAPVCRTSRKHCRDLEGELLSKPPWEARDRLKREMCCLSLKGVGCLPGGAWPLLASREVVPGRPSLTQLP